MKKLKVISAFSGLGGGELALKQLGIESVNFSYEIDKYAEAVNRFHNSDNTKYLGNILNWEQHKNLIGEDVGLIMGGSPCQDLSSTNFSTVYTGLDGQKSGLFYTLVDMIKYYKPRYFFVENVASMRNKDKNKFSEILGVEPYEVNSGYISGQRRNRYYWTNLKFTPTKGRDISAGDILEDKNFLIDGGKAKTILSHYFRHDLRSLVFSNRTKKFERIENPSEEILKNIHKGGNRYMLVENGRVYVEDAPKVFRDTYKFNLPDGVYKLHSFTVKEVERLFNIPDNYTEYGKFSNGDIKKISNGQRYRMLGNGWVVGVIKDFFKNIEIF